MKPEYIKNILFITWDGPETFYLENLFLPIFRGLKEKGFNLHVLQFGWGDTWRDRRAAVCEEAGIPYRGVEVARKMGAAGPFVTALFGGRHIRQAVNDWVIDTLMPRSLMPALAVQRMRREDLGALAVVFDADGLPADERVDFGGRSPHGLTYRLLRDVEAEMLRRSEVVLCRTVAARRILLARAGAVADPATYCVVPNGVDPQRFARALADRPQDESATQGFTLCYCGSVGEQYRLTEMLDIACKLKRFIGDLNFKILAPSLDKIAVELKRQGLSEAQWITARTVQPREVAQVLSRCDLAIALRLRRFSTQAVQPIKIGEYLLAGLPVIGTPGVGDTAWLEAEGVFRSAETADIDDTIRWILEEVKPRRSYYRQKCHDIGMEKFSVQQTVEGYSAALKAYSNKNPS